MIFIKTWFIFWPKKITNERNSKNETLKSDFESNFHCFQLASFRMNHAISIAWWLLFLVQILSSDAIESRFECLWVNGFGCIEREISGNTRCEYPDCHRCHPSVIEPLSSKSTLPLSFPSPFTWIITNNANLNELAKIKCLSVVCVCVDALEKAVLAWKTKRKKQKSTNKPSGGWKSTTDNTGCVTFMTCWHSINVM